MRVPAPGKQRMLALGFSSRRQDGSITPILSLVVQSIWNVSS